MQSVLEGLSLRSKESKSLLCFGIDPVLERIHAAPGGPHKDEHIDAAICAYFNPIIDRLLEEHTVVALKPNHAYFAQYGFEGLYALQNIINRYSGKVPIIFDAKRGDIGKSSEAYAKEAYDVFHADAVTVSPYMGKDSVLPFIREGKLAYMLCRTSNPGAADFQEQKTGKSFLFERVAKLSLAWKTGLVVGATSTAIKKIASLTKNQVPFLIPGVGSQGGDLGMVMKALSKNPYIHRINASSSIAYAFEKKGTDAVSAAYLEASKVVKEMRKFL